MAGVVLHVEVRLRRRRHDELRAVRSGWRRRESLCHMLRDGRRAASCAAPISSQPIIACRACDDVLHALDERRVLRRRAAPALRRRRCGSTAPGVIAAISRDDVVDERVRRCAVGAERAPADIDARVQPRGGASRGRLQPSSGYDDERRVDVPRHVDLRHDRDVARPARSARCRRSRACV